MCLTVRNKFDLNTTDVIKLVTEDDGTSIDLDYEIFDAYGNSGIYIVLRNNELWVPRNAQETKVNKKV